MHSPCARLFTGALLLGSLALAQSNGDGFVDVLYMKVKPGKGGEFHAITKKIADANRRYKGSDWLAFQAEYGPGGTYMIASPRKDYAAVDLAGKMFMQAMTEGFTAAGAQKLLEDAGNLLVDSRAELHRRRMDLSWNAPSDPEELNKIVGASRWMRAMTIRVRPGRNLDFEDLLKTIKANAEKAEPKVMTLVSQSAVGTDGPEFYLSSFRDSLSAFDRTSSPTLRSALGEEGFRKFTAGIADTERGASTVLYRIAPELSNPRPEIAAADPAFWSPKPAPAAARRGAAAAPKK